MSSSTVSDGMGGVAAELISAHGKPLIKEEADYLVSSAQWPNVWGECVSALLLQRSLGKHADALNSAAAASDRYAKALVRATWALVIVTLALVIIGVIQVFH